MGAFETKPIVSFPTVLAAGTHVFRVNTRGNSILSTLYVRAATGTVTVTYFDYGASNNEDVTAKISLGSHPVLSANQTDRRVVTRIHNNVQVEVTVSAGTAEIGILASVVSDFPIDLKGSILDAQVGNLLVDGGLPVVTYDSSDGKFYLLRSVGGTLAFTQVANLTTGIVEVDTIGAANVEQSHTFPASTKRYLVKPRGAGRLNLSFTSGTTGTVYMEISPGSSFESPELVGAAHTIYFQSPLAGLKVELLSWS